MKRLMIKIRNIVTMPFCLFALCLLPILFFSCSNKKKEQIAENEFYVCSMDPQVMEKQPGTCPICKMPLAKTVVDKSTLHIIKLNNEQIKLANIKIDTLKSSSIAREHTLAGVFSINQNTTEQVSSRVGGRIEQLYFKIPGEQVNKGDKLYDVYSQELLLAEQEYLIALEQKGLPGTNGENMLNAAKNKLLLWGLSESQIENLGQTKHAGVTHTIYSNASGIITEIPLREGDFVNEGTKIFQLADINSLWVEVQLYTTELGYLEEGRKVEIIPEGYAAENMEGEVIFVNPELQGQTRINLVRIEVNNNRKLFKPGQQANVVLKSDEKKAMVLPRDAVLQDGKNTLIWIESKKGEFEARKVVTGIESKDKVEILSGVKEGESVVISGAYLLNSEFIFKRGMVPTGENQHVH